MLLTGPRSKRATEAGLGIIATLALVVAVIGLALLLVWITVLVF